MSTRPETENASALWFRPFALAERCGVHAIHYQHSLTSTNDAALKLAGTADLATPTLVLADEQSAGRGRGDNRWWTGAGGLAFSLIVDLPPDLMQGQRWPLVSLACGLAVCQTLEPRIGDASPGGSACGIRWPNDVYVAGRKICGVLPELPALSVGTLPNPGDAPSRLVIGVGLNVNNPIADAPSDLQGRAISLVDLTGNVTDRAELLVGLVHHILSLLAQASDNPQTIVAACQSRCLLRGREVELQLGTDRSRGVCHGIDADGALVLATATGERRFFGGVILSAS